MGLYSGHLWSYSYVHCAKMCEYIVISKSQFKNRVLIIFHNNVPEWYIVFILDVQLWSYLVCSICQQSGNLSNNLFTFPVMTIKFTFLERNWQKKCIFAILKKSKYQKKKSKISHIMVFPLLYDKVYGYYSMWNVRTNINQRNIESTQKLTEYVY